MKRVRDLLILSLLLSATAESSHLSGDCVDAPYRAGLNQCLEETEEKLNVELNQIHRAAVDSFNDLCGDGPSLLDCQKLKEEFIVVQHNWAVLKKDECHIEATYVMGAGSGASTLYLNCLVTKTEARINYLKGRFYRGKY